MSRIDQAVASVLAGASEENVATAVSELQRLARDSKRVNADLEAAHTKGRADERAAIRQLCLDEASREGTKAKAAKKKGHVDDAVIARCSADAFRKMARMLAPPKPKKARKVTK